MRIKSNQGEKCHLFDFLRFCAFGGFAGFGAFGACKIFS